MESRWDILTLGDKKILGVLYKDEAGTNVSQLSRRTDLQPKQVYNSIKRLKRLKFIDILSKSPLLIKLNLKADTIITFLQVECPKCKKTRYIDFNQNTAVCKNENCKTKSNKQTRFYITKHRIVGTPEHIKLKEKQANKEIKKDMGGVVKIIGEDYF